MKDEREGTREAKPATLDARTDKLMRPVADGIPVSLDDIVQETKLTQAIEAREKSYIERLATLDNAEEIFERRAEMLTRCRLIAIRQTNPEDWVLGVDKDGRAIAFPAVSACDKIAEVYGINMENVRPLDSRGAFDPEKINNPDGSYTLRAWCDGFSLVTGRNVHALEASRTSTEDFVGRTKDFKTNAPSPSGPSDLRAATMSLLRSKLVRVLSGCSKVPASVLDEAWTGTGKTTARCTKGHGYGSSKERTAEKVISGDVKAEAAKLWEEILRRTGGDTEAAKGLLKEITSFKKDDGSAFPGYQEHTRIGSTGMLKSAWTKLAKHGVFGDGAQKGDGDARD